MRYAEIELTSEDSQTLFVRHYQPATDGAARTLVIVHVVCEHGERYDHVARLIVEHGWNVVVTDLPGHGRSGGIRTHVGDFRLYIRDLELVLRHFGLASEQTAMLGHSMGGLIAIRYVQELPDRVAALVLSSPLLRMKVAVHPVTIALGRMLSVVVPRARFRSRINPADTTRDPLVLQRRLNDPLMPRSVTAGWYFAMQEALRLAWKQAPGMQLPLLVLQAGEDRIVDPGAPRLWLETVGSGDKTFRCLPDHFHELLNEPDWRETTASILDWLGNRIG